jgi:hypothetical protein
MMQSINNTIYTIMKPNRYFLKILVLLMSVLLIGCSAINVTTKHTTEHKINKMSKWAVLPVSNYSESPFAGEKVESILESILIINGIKNLSKYPNLEKPGEIPLLDSQLRFQRGLEWAKDNNYKYCVYGNIEEWRYINGVERKPAVGITLYIQDVETGKVYWTGTASATGSGRESVSGVAKELLTKMIAHDI